MANQPAEKTKSISFTLPRALNAALQRRVESSMHSKSDIVREALMNYLSQAERDAVMAEIAAAGGSRYSDYPRHKAGNHLTVNSSKDDQAAAKENLSNYKTRKKRKSS